jgi:hypothetical protein
LLDRSTKKFTLCLNLHSTQVGTLNFIFDTTVRRNGSLNRYKAHMKSAVLHLSHKHYKHWYLLPFMTAYYTETTRNFVTKRIYISNLKAMQKLTSDFHIR